MRHPTLQWIGVAFAAGALLALDRSRSRVLGSLAELIAEVAAAALVARAKGLIDRKEQQPC